MKIYNLPRLAESNANGEYCLGTQETGTGSVYILYGRLRPGETSHKMALPEGHEEIICVVKGRIRVNCGKRSFNVETGEAFNPGISSQLSLDNVGDGEAIYISARGCAGADAEKPAPEPGPQTEKPAPELFADTLTDEDEDEFEIINDGVPLEE